MPLTFYKKPALVVYVTCGDPNLATTREIVMAAIDAGADVIELGVPFSDPVADGPVIQRASERALKLGTSLAQVLTLAAEIRQQAQSTATCPQLSESARAPRARSRDESHAPSLDTDAPRAHFPTNNA